MTTVSAALLCSTRTHTSSAGKPPVLFRLELCISGISNKYASIVYLIQAPAAYAMLGYRPSNTM
uniref:Uncharacterized protein n=1 Tax=Anguilla anguilla TaxID=7936 RepID=A0A0E9UAW0_ANGAN